MDVEVRLFAALQQGRFRKQTMELPDGISLGGLLERLDIPEEDVSLPLVNGRHSELDSPLAADDIVSLFPSMGGG